MPVSPPAGYHSVTPAIIVRDAAGAIDFYKRAFGAKEVSRFEGPDGTVMHAEILIGDSRVMLGEESPQFNTKSPLSTDGPTSSLHLYVPDADAAFEKALKAGATIQSPLEDAFWGDRYGKVVDPFGHQWGISTRIREMSDAEQAAAGAEWMAKMATN